MLALLSSRSRDPWAIVLPTLILLNIAAVAAPMIHFWDDLGRGFGGRYERNWIAWFTSVQLVLAGFVAGLIWLFDRSRTDAAGRHPRGTWLWLVFALALGFLGLDEFMAIHERIESYVAVNHLDRHSDDAPGFVLPICALLGVAPAILLIIRFSRECKPARNWFLLAAAISFTAIALDVLHMEAWPRIDLVRRVAEDSLELIGAGVFLITFLRYYFWLVQPSKLPPPTQPPAARTSAKAPEPVLC